MVSNIKILLAIIYIISPIDLLPEAVLGPLGFADDIGALIYIIQALAKKVAYRRGREKVTGCLKSCLGFFLVIVIVVILVVLGIYFDIFSVIFESVKNISSQV